MISNVKPKESYIPSLATFAVIGNPVHHSLSPIIHHHFAQQTDRPLQYLHIKAELDNFENTVRALFKRSEFQGANVTLPFKEQAFELVDECSERALKAQAVNTIKRLPNGLLWGDNTDGVGLIRDLQKNNIQLMENSVVVLGAGGAAKGIIHNIIEQSPAILTLVNRNINKLEEWSSALREKGIPRKFNCSDYTGLQGCFDVVINTTSMGHQGLYPQLDITNFHPGSVFYDLSYGLAFQPIESWLRNINIRRRDGLGMLVEQAAESFYVWQGVMPDTTMTEQYLRAYLARKE